MSFEDIREEGEYGRMLAAGQVLLRCLQPLVDMAQEKSAFRRYNPEPRGHKYNTEARIYPSRIDAADPKSDDIRTFTIEQHVFDDPVTHKVRSAVIVRGNAFFGEQESTETENSFAIALFLTEDNDSVAYVHSVYETSDDREEMSPDNITETARKLDYVFRERLIDFAEPD